MELFKMIKEIDRPEMEELVKGGAQLVDVRESDEVAGGMIPGAVHMPLSSFDEFKTQLSSEKPIVFYCRSGRRSLKTAEMAENWGHAELYSLRGGYLGYTGQAF